MKLPKIDRTRRNLLKAIGIVGAAVAATAGFTRPATANHDSGHGVGHQGGACFLRGTRIRTDDGYRPIERLSAGDRVIAHFAKLAPIRTVSSFTLERTGPGGSWAGPLRPVRIRRGALGDNVPTADVCLTAAHAVLRGGVLVPVGSLLNGTSIVLEPADGHPTLEFFHIELEGHDVLDAEGAPCESLGIASVEPCVPLLAFHGGRDELRSRLRSMASIAVDRRQPLDVVRDDLEERGRLLYRGVNTSAPTPSLPTIVHCPTRDPLGCSS
jgi:hypothetical protein